MDEDLVAVYDPGSQVLEECLVVGDADSRPANGECQVEIAASQLVDCVSVPDVAPCPPLR